MSKFGKKFVCWKCATKFYDLNKPGAHCPKCDADPEDDPHKGVPAPAPATFGDDAVDVEEELTEDIPGTDDEDLDDDGTEETPEAPGADEDF